MARCRFDRDITYWLSISGRADELIAGLICSEDILYFIIVIAVFLGFCIIKLQSGKQRTTWYMVFSKYVGVFIVAIFLGYLSSRPMLKFFHDSTANKIKTLTKSSQDIMSQMTCEFDNNNVRESCLRTIAGQV